MARPQRNHVCVRVSLCISQNSSVIACMRIHEFALSVWSPLLKCTGATMDRAPDASTRRAGCGQALTDID